jgi:hypothetical protein
MLNNQLHSQRQDLLQLLMLRYTQGCEVDSQIAELCALIAQDKAELHANAMTVADYLIDEPDTSRWADMATRADPADALAQLAMLRGLHEATRRQLSLRMVLAIRTGRGSGPEILMEIKDLKQALAALDAIVSILESVSGAALVTQCAPRQREVAGDQPHATCVDTTILRQQNLLASNRNNLNHLMRQVQVYGGFEYAPMRIRNNIRAAHINIAAIESQLCDRREGQRVQGYAE